MGATSAVIRLGYVHIRVTDLEEARNHYTNTLGMDVVHEEPGKLWLKCWDEYDHHSLVLEEGGVGLVKLGYKGENLTVGDGVRITLPSEQNIELFKDIEFTGTKTGSLNPDPWPRDSRGI